MREGRETRIATPQGELYAVRWMPPRGEDADRTPVVLLHDSLGSVSLWRRFPARLACILKRPVVAYDRLGYGRSAPYPGAQPPSFIDDEASSGFAAVREHLGLARFMVLGHSVGGCMAAAIAAMYPEACQGLITVAAQAFTEPRTLVGIRTAERAFAVPGQMERLARHHGDKADWVLRAWVDTWHSEPFRHWRLDEALGGVRCPTLAVHGERDEYGSPQQPRRIAALTPGPADPLMLPDCGHVPHRECPERLIDGIASFVAASTAC